MKPSTILASLGLIVVITGIWFFINSATAPKAPVLSDYKNTSYTIDGLPIALVNGKAETEAAPGSASKTITQFFGNEANGDLNGDGIEDSAFILTQQTGGSGTFFYVVAALKKADDTYTGTNAILLGDRIAPQTTEIANGQIVVNFAERKPDEPMSANPSVGVTKRLQITGTNLVELARVVGKGERCGGNMTTAPVCSTGLHCAPVAGSRLPFGDVGGTCVAD